METGHADRSRWFWHRASLRIRLWVKERIEVVAETVESVETLWSGFDDFLLGLKHLASFPFDKHADCFTHPPAGRAEHLEPVHAGHEHGDAPVTEDTDAFGK